MKLKIWLPVLLPAVLLLAVPTLKADEHISLAAVTLGGGPVPCAAGPCTRMSCCQAGESHRPLATASPSPPRDIVPAMPSAPLLGGPKPVFSGKPMSAVAPVPGPLYLATARLRL